MPRLLDFVDLIEAEIERVTACLADEIFSKSLNNQEIFRYIN